VNIVFNSSPWLGSTVKLPPVGAAFVLNTMEEELLPHVNVKTYEVCIAGNAKFISIKLTVVATLADTTLL
jgi:hypothetical protein